VGADGKTLSLDDLSPNPGDTAEKLAKAGDIIDVSGAKVYQNGSVTNLTKIPALASLKDLITDGRTAYRTLSDIIMLNIDVLGYRRALDTENILGTGNNKYEMILTQPKIDALGNGESYMAFTSYVPPVAVCGDNGRSYLQMVDTFTGLPAPYMYGLFSSFYPENPAVQGGQVPGYIEAGRGKSTEATIVKVEGRTKIMTSGQDGSIYELNLDNLDTMPQGVISWREVLDMGFTLSDKAMTGGLPGSVAP
jgi:hypothetical protein